MTRPGFRTRSGGSIGCAMNTVLARRRYSMMAMAGRRSHCESIVVRCPVPATSTRFPRKASRPPQSARPAWSSANRARSRNCPGTPKAGSWSRMPAHSWPRRFSASQTACVSSMFARLPAARPRTSPNSRRSISWRLTSIARASSALRRISHASTCAHASSPRMPGTSEAGGTATHSIGSLSMRPARRQASCAGIRMANGCDAKATSQHSASSSIGCSMRCGRVWRKGAGCSTRRARYFARRTTTKSRPSPRATPMCCAFR